MKFLTLAAIAATLIAKVGAHTILVDVIINGVNQGAGAGSYIREPPTNEPILNLTSPNLRCNTNGFKPLPHYVPVPAGGVVTTQWSMYVPSSADQ